MARSLFWTDAYQRWINALSPFEFEHVVADIYGADGWAILETTQKTRDGGYDIRQRRDGELRLTDAKQREGTLSSTEITTCVDRLQDEYDLERFDSIAFVTSGSLTKPAKRTARQATADTDTRIRLVDGRELHRLIRDHELHALPEQYGTPVPEPDGVATSALNW